MPLFAPCLLQVLCFIWLAPDCKPHASNPGQLQLLLLQKVGGMSQLCLAAAALQSCLW